MRIAILLVSAAILETGGDALVRIGLQRRALPMLVGAGCLVAYGVVVNLGSLDFGRLMGTYIVTFFVLSQIIAALAFSQPPTLRTATAGVLMIAAGAVLTL